MSIPSMVKRSEKTFISFHFEAKQSEKNVYFVSLWSETKRSEAKRKMFGSKIKRKYALLILLWSEAKNSKRNEAKKKFSFSRERAKRMRNGSRFASFRFEAKKFFLRNRRTLLQILSPSVLSTSLHPLLLLTTPPPASCVPSPRHTRREDLEQFPTTESLAWASVINSYSLLFTLCPNLSNSWIVLLFLSESKKRI